MDAKARSKEISPLTLVRHEAPLEYFMALFCTLPAVSRIHFIHGGACMTRIFFSYILTFALLSLSLVAGERTNARGITRDGNGRPGPGYWQQQVHYRLDATLRPGEHRLDGAGTVTYENNSPDTLRTIFWHVYQNIFRKDSEARKVYGDLPRSRRLTEGMTVDSVVVEGQLLPVRVHSTIMETPLVHPLLPGGRIAIGVRWWYDIPQQAEMRSGSIGNDFGMCQWYPQIAVYDDRRGWDTTQYMGYAEFYTEYGDWQVAIHVPGDYVVAATGMLENPADVLTAAQLARYNAATSDSTIAVIPAEETDAARSGLHGEERAWHFTAQRVRDFAWAASPKYVWDVTKTTQGARINAFYHPDERTASFPFVGAAHNWDVGAQLARRTIEFYSSRFGPYVYPQATVVSGPVTGMEYPMLVFVSSGDAVTAEMEQTMIHELGHEWYPMMIGSDETTYAPMDEGFNTFITSMCVANERGGNAMFTREMSAKFGGLLPPNDERLFNMRPLLRAERNGRTQSLLTPSYQMPPSQYGVTVYNKTAAVMMMLRDVLGPDMFERAMKEYYSRWLFKHPMPEDFFHTIEDVSGRDLTWFWHEWFEETWTLDLAVCGVTNEPSGSGWNAAIRLRNLGQAVMPATVRLRLADGTAKDIRVPETTWMYRRNATVRVNDLPAKVRRVEIDPDQILLDVDRLNNTSGLPNVDFGFGLNLLNPLLYPLDAYRMNLGPSVGFNARDGFELGVNLTGSYLNSDYDFSLSARYGLRSGIPDFTGSFTTPLQFFSRNLSTTVKGYRLDGRSGYEWSVDGIWRQPKDLLSSYARFFGVSTSIFSMAVKDARYLERPTDWAMGDLVAGTIGLRYGSTYSWGRWDVRMGDEFGTVWSSFNYVKYTADARLDASLSGGFRSKLRLFVGSSAGDVPPQTAFSLVQASPREQFESWWFRTPWTTASLREHLRSPGGGNVFLSRDTTGLNLASVNLELRRGPFVLFADAGVLSDSNEYRDVYSDAGAAFVLTFGGNAAFDVDLPPFGIGFYVPFYVNDPTRPKDDAFAWRWNIVLGVRL